MDSSRAGVLVALLLVALAAGQGPVAGSAGPGPGGTGTAGGGAAPALVALQMVPETDTTVTRIAVAENGTATWELSIRTRLETDEAAAEYRAFQERFRANRSRFVAEFRAGVTGIVANARSVTGREMTASGFRASTTVQTVPRRWGVVTYEFRWHGFAAADGDRLVVGDVFEGGLFIAEGDALVVVGPAGYGVASADPTPDDSGDGRVSWQGREDFADGRPQVTFAPTGGGEAGAGVPPTAILGGLALLGVLTLAAVGLRRRRARSVGGGDDSSEGVAPSDPAVGTPVLADEDYVRRALAESGGRMRQAELAEALDWSSSKTSRVLSRMAEDGTVRKLRLGRENVIDLVEGEEP